MPKRSLLALPFSLLASLAAISLAAPAGAQSVAIAFEGDPEPGGSGGTYSALRAPVVNDSGVVAFRSSIASGSATSGVYRDAGSGVAAIALTGDLAPDTGGGTFTSFDSDGDGMDDAFFGNFLSLMKRFLSGIL